MAWSYSGDPSDSDRDAVRWLVQDVNTDNQLATDEEIDFELTEQGSVNGAAVAVAVGIQASLALNESQFIRLDYGRLIKRLRQRLTEGVSVYAGGISETSKESQVSDSDRVKPAFRRTAVVDDGEDD